MKKNGGSNKIWWNFVVCVDGWLYSVYMQTSNEMMLWKSAEKFLFSLELDNSTSRSSILPRFVSIIAVVKGLVFSGLAPLFIYFFLKKLLTDCVRATHKLIQKVSFGYNTIRCLRISRNYYQLRVRVAKDKATERNQDKERQRERGRERERAGAKRRER